MENISQTIAQDLLKIRAVFFRPEEPFTWASGSLPAGEHCSPLH